MTGPTLSFLQVAEQTIGYIRRTQAGPVQAAGQLLADRIVGGGVIHAFGTGHARCITLELAGRAGGLACVNLMAIKDLVLRGGADPAEILDPRAERDAGLAERVLRLSDVRAGDAFVIASNSGVNGAVVEMASLVSRRGLPIVAITSVQHSLAVPSRHHSGRRLLDLSDVVIDTGAPVGDAAVRLDNGARTGGVSSFAGVLIAQLLTEAVARRLLAAGQQPPLLTSMNLPEGDSRNADLFSRYEGRVRPIEP